MAGLSRLLYRLMRKGEIPFVVLTGRTASGVSVLMRDREEKILMCSGTTKPADTAAGFAKGCIFIKTDAATGTKALYENKGTKTSCTFDVIGDISASEITIANTKVLIGSAGGVAVAYALSDDVTMTNIGGVTIGANVVTNAKAAQMATKTYKGRTTAATGNAEDVPAATVKVDLALGNVDNTTDANKPVSTAQQTALDLKSNAASPVFTGVMKEPYQELTASGAIAANTVGLNHASDVIAATLAAPVAGQRCTIIDTSASGTAAHTVTCAAGVTFDGTNNTATLNAPNEALDLMAVSATRWFILENIGTVGLSAV